MKVSGDGWTRGLRHNEEIATYTTTKKRNKARTTKLHKLPYLTRIAKTIIMKVEENKYQVIALLCLLQLSIVQCEGHECGDNPMRQVLLVAKRTGRTLSHVLTLLKEIDNPAYDNLSRQFRTYAACVGLVDTGYFKKRAYNEYVRPPYVLELSKGKPIKPSLPYDAESVLPERKPENAQPEEIFIHQENPTKGLDSYEDQTKQPKVQQLYDKMKSDLSFDKKNSRNYNVERLKKWLYGPYRNYMNSYYLRWNLLWPLVHEE